MQFWSFDSRDPIFEFDGWQLSIQIVTLENTYGLADDHCTVKAHANGKSWTVTCDALSWAAQQQRASGNCTVKAQRERDGHLRVSITATAPHKIRCIKLLLRGLPEITALDMCDQPIATSTAEYGWMAEYPTRLRTPVQFMQTDDGGELYGFRCEDMQVRAKRFAMYRELFGARQNTRTVELIAEADARHFETTFAAPDWVLGRAVQMETFREAYLRYAEKHLGLVPWEKRNDMPKWTRDIGLCLTIHGMHWSGYIFNTYDQMTEVIQYVAQRIPGKHVLAYLPGWEGRYYWQYGDYRPEPLLGGAPAFARLCDTAKSLGVHVMPMFGGNCVNSWFPNFHEYGPDAYMKSATRNRFHGNQPDWDLARAHDTGWQAWLNPGHPAWQAELCRQILNLQDEFKFDSIFLDTIHAWCNDPDFSIFQGNVEIARRLREGRPDVLVTAETWYDAMMGVYPIFQDSRQWMLTPKWSARYIRHVAHLLEQEPSRGSTGVHELGYQTYAVQPVSKGSIPTVAFVDGTLEANSAGVDTVIAQAKDYLKLQK